MYLGDQKLEEDPTSEDAFLQHLFDQNFSNFWNNFVLYGADLNLWVQN